MAKLLIDGINGARVTFPLCPGETLIGRMDSSHLVLEDPAVSRIHAKIVMESGGATLVDLESRVGTRVNGEMIQRHRLRDGDVIEIASVRMEFRE
jgi:pSer/pThr/pTyr-binding forkhead associated (FHA) protein